MFWSTAVTSSERLEPAWSAGLTRKTHVELALACWIAVANAAACWARPYWPGVSAMMRTSLVPNAITVIRAPRKRLYSSIMARFGPPHGGLSSQPRLTKLGTDAPADAATHV